MIATAVSIPSALRDYQLDAIRAIGEAHAAGRNRLLVSLPTGTGKTVIFADIIRRRPGRSLVLAHRDELIAQAVAKLRTANPTASIGVVKAERDEHTTPIVVASVQTLANQPRLARLATDFQTVIVDEAHHASAPTYRRVLEHVGSFLPDGPLTIGFTATPERADGQALGDVWDGGIVERREILEMIQAGWLCDLRAVQVRLQADFRRLHVRAGDLIDTEVADLLRSARVADHTLAAWQRHAAGRTTVIFTPIVDLAREMAERFRRGGVAAEALDGGTPTDERRAILHRLATGDTTVVANCAVLTEGFDLPRLSCIVIARPTRSRPLYVQMIGRGLRPERDKPDCLILDLAGVTERHDIQSVGDLFGLTAGQLAGRSVREAIALYEAAERERMVREAVPDPAGARLVSRSVSVFHRRPAHLANPSASWRRDPASTKQIEVLRRSRLPVRPGITKGEASDLIAASMEQRRRAE